MRRLLHQDEPTIQVTNYNNPRVSERRQLFVHEIYLFLLYIIIYILTCKNALCAAMIMVGDSVSKKTTQVLALKLDRKYDNWRQKHLLSSAAKFLVSTAMLLFVVFKI